MLYGGITAAAGLGSCSVWKDCVRTSTENGPYVALRPAFLGSVFCDVTATRSAKSAR